MFSLVYQILHQMSTFPQGEAAGAIWRKRLKMTKSAAEWRCDMIKIYEKPAEKLFRQKMRRQQSGSARWDSPHKCRCEKYILRRERLDFSTKYGQITSISPTNHLILPVVNWLFYPSAQKEIGKKSTKAGIAVEISAGWWYTCICKSGVMPLNAGTCSAWEKIILN